MLVGILWALLAGLMLGLYAIPGKYTKNFKEENTWGLFFMLTMFVVPIAATLVIMKDVGDIYGTPEVRAILPQMVITSVLWGIGVMMWGKAIHHIGVSLGFSLFIGTVIVSGIVTGEWKLASAKAKNLLYTGLACMVVGILIISVGNKFASDIPSQEPVAATSPAELPSN